MIRSDSNGSPERGGAVRGAAERPIVGPEQITQLAYDPEDPQFRSDPADYYRFLRDEAPVHRHGGVGAYLLSRFEDVWEATADFATYSSESPVARFMHMSSMDPPGHDRLRASVARFFSPSKIAALEPLVRVIARELLDGVDARLVDGERVDFVEAFAALYPSRVIHRLLGVAPER
ncbi:cytochrome P450, partial [Myxococcota bacterium]|nr:cytochrome P450 [Myxococcota bacterium]